MVGFMIPIPGKVVDGAFSKGSQFVNSYKKEPVATDLGGRPVEKAGHAPHASHGSINVPLAPVMAAARWGAANVPQSMPQRSAPTGRQGDFGPQLLEHVLGGVALLESMGQITPEAARRAAAALAGEPDPHEAPAARHAPPPRRNTGPAAASHEDRATALWDYGQGSADADDLAFAAGDTVIIDEVTNDAWFRGRTIPKGRTAPLPKQGLFPANYVERQ